MGTIERQIEEAKQGGASSQQLEILNDARSSANVTVEQARMSMQATVECFSQSGLGAAYEDYVDSSGLLIPSYRVSAEVPGLDDAEVEALIQHCEVRESYWVNYLYQTQPASREVRDEHLREGLPALLACLNDHGVEVSPEAPLDEIVIASNKLFGETAEGGNPVNCIDEATSDDA